MEEQMNSSVVTIVLTDTNIQIAMFRDPSAF